MSILIILVRSTFSITIEPDSELNGIVYLPFKGIYNQIHTEYLTYKFNASLMSYITENRNVLEQTCPDNIMNLQLYDTTMQNMGTIWNSSETIFDTNNTIKINPTIFVSLESKIRSFSKTNCGLIELINADLININTQLNKLADSKLTSLHELISLERFQSDVMTLVYKNDKKYKVPFTQKLFTSEIGKYISYKYYFDSKMVYIQFEIPFFDITAYKLYQIYTKPIIWENSAYIFNTSIKYATIDSPWLTIFTESEYQRLCEPSIQSIYCKTPKTQSDHCFADIANRRTNNFKLDCFNKLKAQNMITQIGKQIYFTIFSPIELRITDHSLFYTTSISHTSKIIEKINYNITTSFFSFTPGGGDKYEIFYDNKQLNDNLFHKFNFRGRNELLFFTIVILLLITSVKIIWDNLFIEETIKQEIPLQNTLSA